MGFVCGLTQAINHSLLSSPFFQSNLPQLPPSSSSTSQKVTPVPAPLPLPPAGNFGSLKGGSSEGKGLGSVGTVFLQANRIVLENLGIKAVESPSRRDSAGSVLRQGFCVSGNPERLRSTADSFVQSLEVSHFGDKERDENFPQEGVVCGGALSYRSFDLQGSMRVHHHNPDSRPLEGLPYSLNM
ncbi:hypothetical protein F2Q69_00005549 [Brassica cretica]|uniref:Uncharacterized protein n=1 Tax=Brassica cretica TaxID=69181 RepID=A0A8S9NY02_BRACR|nr:hypothetical protein F2Q69_00005549 [Brassica cretica]